jgi:hypothetical protein
MTSFAPGYRGPDPMLARMSQQQGGFGGGFGMPQQQGGYGMGGMAPPGFGMPQQQGGYGMGGMAPPGFGMPQQQGGFGHFGMGGGYGMPRPRGGFGFGGYGMGGMPQGFGGFGGGYGMGGMPQGFGGFGGGYGMPQQQRGFGGFGGGYGMPQQQGGFSQMSGYNQMPQQMQQPQMPQAQRDEYNRLSAMSPDQRFATLMNQASPEERAQYNAGIQQAAQDPSTQRQYDAFRSGQGQNMDPNLVRAIEGLRQMPQQRSNFGFGNMAMPQPYQQGFGARINPNTYTGPPAQGGIAPGAFAIAGDPRNYAKGGLAVKPVWDKKRPKDLGEPKSLSAKKKKSAKARAKAAGRPYPNLVDNMAAARKKGK